MRVEKAKDGAILQPLPHILKLLIISRDVNDRIYFRLNLVTRRFKDIVVSSELKGICHRPLHSFGVAVIRGGSEAYAETGAN